MEIDYLVEKYSKLVYHICYKMLLDPMDAEDITQEVYINLFKTFDRYKDLPENELKNIICKIALNKCRDILRSKMKKIEKMTDQNIISLENYKADNDIEEELFKNERSMLVKKAINDMKKPYDTIMYDYYINNLSLDELAHKNAVGKGTLKMQIHRGKKMLKDNLINIGGESLL